MDKNKMKIKIGMMILLQKCLKHIFALTVKINFTLSVYNFFSLFFLIDVENDE